MSAVDDFLTEIAKGQPSPAALRWLATGFSAWTAGADLAESLGLSRRSQREAARFWLKHAGDLLRDSRSWLGDWKLAQALEQRIAFLPRVRIPDDVDEALTRALQSGRCPRSARRILDVLQATDDLAWQRQRGA